jgi:hypothetical protein
MISQYRRAHGLSAVHADGTLSALARAQANAMAARGTLSHSVAGSFASRIQHANLGNAGENVAMGQKSWADALRAWKSSSGHNRNLLMPGASRVGVAVAHAGGRAYWAMVIAGGPETRTVRVIGPNGRRIVGATQVRGMPFMTSMQPTSRRAARNAGPRDFNLIKGEVTGRE